MLFYGDHITVILLQHLKTFSFLVSVCYLSFIHLIFIFQFSLQHLKDQRVTVIFPFQKTSYQIQCYRYIFPFVNAKTHRLTS